MLVIARVGVAASGVRPERVHVKPGATSAVVAASIKGDEIVDYVLGARQGQYANISMATNNGAHYCNLLAPGENEGAMFNGSNVQNQFDGILPKSGNDKIRVYLIRSTKTALGIAERRPQIDKFSPACRCQQLAGRNTHLIVSKPTVHTLQSSSMTSQVQALILGSYVTFVATTDYPR